MRNSNNLAYDFERFETRVPKKKQQEQPAIRIVKDNQKKKAAQLMLFKSISIMLCAGAITFLMLFNQARLNEIGIQISDSNETLSVLQSEQARLSSEIETKMSLRNIEEAAAAMGLSKIEDYQVESFNLSEGSRIEVPGSSEISIWSKIGMFLNDIKEYLNIKL